MWLKDGYVILEGAMPVITKLEQEGGRGRESLFSTTYFTLLGKRARLFTKSRKGTTLHLKNGGLYLVLGFMMHYSLDKWNLVFCAAVKK